MKLTLEPTDVVRTVNGCECREWKGTDEEGVEVIALIAAVAPQPHDETVAERYRKSLVDKGFAREPAIDLRHVL